MSTTDQHSTEARPDPATASGWAVPGVGLGRPSPTEEEPGSAPGRTAAAHDIDGGRNGSPPRDPGADFLRMLVADASDSISPAEDEPVDVIGELRTAGARPGAAGLGAAGLGVAGLGAAGLSAGDCGGAAGGGDDGVHPILTAVLTCLEAVQGIRGISATGLSAREIRLMLLAVAHLAAAVCALRLRLLVAGEVQRVHDLTGATSVAAFFGHLTRTSRIDARRQARLAQDLDRRYPLLLDALEQGLISAEQADIAAQALRRLPRKEVTAEQIEACQRFLIEAAQHFAPDQLRVLGKKLWHVIDPDGAERREGKALEDEEELAKAKAYFKSWRNGDGTTSFKGKLPDLQATMLTRALQAVAAPARRKNPNITTSQPDDMRHPQPDDQPTREGTHPQPTDKVHDEPEIGHQPGDSGICDGGCEGGCDGGSGAEGGASCDGCSDGGCGGGNQPEEPEVPYPVRLGHALMELIERYPLDRLDHSAGNNARIVVTMTLEQLETALGVVTLDDGTEASAAQMRRLACEAGLIPLVLGGDSQPLDVGREQRLHTGYQRTVLKVVHKTCATIGCDRPASMAHIHHPIPFSEGGCTSVHNGAPLCPYHHGLAHSSHWKITWHGRKARFTRIDWP